MSRNDEAPTLRLISDEQLELEAREQHDRAVEWASMTATERAAALRADRPAAEEAQAAARAEGLVE